MFDSLMLIQTSRTIVGHSDDVADRHAMSSEQSCYPLCLHTPMPYPWPNADLALLCYDCGQKCSGCQQAKKTFFLRRARERAAMTLSVKVSFQFQDRREIKDFSSLGGAFSREKVVDDF